MTVSLYRMYTYMYYYIQIGLPCIYGYTDVQMDVVLQMCQYMYTTWDHGPALSGHQGSSLSLKHGLCVSASLNSLHTVPLKTGRGHSTCGKSPATRPWSWGCSYCKRAKLSEPGIHVQLLLLYVSFRVYCNTQYGQRPLRNAPCGHGEE